MELVLLLSLLCTVVHGVDFDPQPNNWTQGESGSFSCSNSVSVIVNKNGKEVITCTTDGSNICSKPAPSYAKVTVTGTTLNFTILNLDRARDTATWECSGLSTFIDVKIPVPNVTIVNKNSLIFTDGQTTSITCKAGVSYPPASITWSIGGTTITGETPTNNPDGTTTSILQYTPDKTDHNKILQCSATNGYNSSKSDSITLNIRSPPELKDDPNINQCSHVEVTVFANPPPTCKWLFNGKDPEEKFIIVSDSNEHTCKISSIPDVRNIPHGDYYVNISNELGFISHDINIPEVRDIYPVYLLIVQGLRIVIVILLLIIIIIGTGKGTNVTTIVSIITGVVIAVCVIILIYVLVHIKEVFWIIVSCLMVVFSILTAILIPIIHLLLTKKVEDKNVKSVFWGLMVLSAVVILFSLALLIFICVILAQYDVCEKDNLIGGACLQAVDVLFTIGLTGLVYKKLGL